MTVQDSCVFAKEVKKALIDVGKNYEWLSEEVTDRTGLYCDSPYISRVLNGERNAPKIVQAIKEILGLE